MNNLEFSAYVDYRRIYNWIGLCMLSCQYSLLGMNIGKVNLFSGLVDLNVIVLIPARIGLIFAVVRRRHG